MPLVKSTLETEIRKITDKDYADFEGFPEAGEVSERWTNAIHSYAKGVIPATTPVSQEAAKSALLAAWQSLEVEALVAFSSGLTAYAAALGLGMQPAFTATPPPTPVVLAPTFAIGSAGGSGADCAKSMASIIHTWFKTGTAVNNTSGATTTWQ